MRFAKVDHNVLLAALQAEEAWCTNNAEARAQAKAEAQELMSSTQDANAEADEEMQDKFFNAVLTDRVMNKAMDQYKEHQRVCKREEEKAKVRQALGSYPLPHNWMIICDERGKFWADIPFTLIYNNQCKQANQYGNVKLTGMFLFLAAVTWAMHKGSHFLSLLSVRHMQPADQVY